MRVSEWFLTKEKVTKVFFFFLTEIPTRRRNLVHPVDTPYLGPKVVFIATFSLLKRSKCVYLSFIQPGAIIRDGDRKRAPFSSIGVGVLIWDNFSIFRTNCVIACGTRAYIAARIFADVAQGKWRSKFPKSFMLLAHNSRPLWNLEFCLRISP